MKKELIISNSESKIKIALLEDSNLVEYNIDNKKNENNVGDVYFGIVKSISSGMNAAFIDLGIKKDAFLHYSDLGENFLILKDFLPFVKKNFKSKKISISEINLSENKPLDKLGKIEDFLKKGDQILVQVKKEPICTKGARLSCDITIAGRYMVLIPFSNSINVSKKISKIEEKNRLKKLIMSLLPKNFGVVIRTVAEGKNVEDLIDDFKFLLKKWEQSVSKLAVAQPFEKVICEISRVSSILRDIINSSFDKIVVDDIDLFDEVKTQIKKIAPEKDSIVKYYNNSQALSLFEEYGIERQLKLSFGKIVTIQSGGYLIIEKTEAMHVIDVNSGSKSMRDTHQEEAILNINLLAAKEIARQIRLRDLGGIIVVDFIDMKSSEDRESLQNKFQEYLLADRSKIKILPISKFGIMQITRQRVRSEINIDVSEKCPSCEGNGKTKPLITITDDIEKKIDFLAKLQNEKNFYLYVHPYIFAYFKNGIISRYYKWIFKYKTLIKLKENSSLAIDQYKFYSSCKNEIQID
jgi:ribonuclease G